MNHNTPPKPHWGWFLLALAVSVAIIFILWTAVNDVGTMERALTKATEDSLKRITAQVETLPRLVATAESDVVKLSDRQLTALQSHMTDSAGAVLQLSIDTRRETLARVDSGVEAVNGIRQTVDQALNGEKGIVASVNTLTVSGALLADRYRLLPDEIANDKIFKAYEAQGLGTLAATKVFMGDAAKAGRTFDTQFPILMANVTETTGHFNHVIQHYDRVLTGPTSVRGKLAEWGKLTITGANAYTHVR